MDKRFLIGGIAAAMAIAAALVVPGTYGLAQTVVMAPGAQIPGAPLPRYVYTTVNADFGVAEGQPLVKDKFNLYDTTGSKVNFDLKLPLMHELNVDNYRIEISWGRDRDDGHGIAGSIGGTPDKLTYDFGPLDHIVGSLKSQDVRFFGALCYTPRPLQDPNLKPRYGEKDAKERNTTPPKDLEKWKEVITSFTKHHKEVGLQFGGNEVWNEPDGTYHYYSGTPEEYQALYKATVAALRAADPDAYIAGPASDHHVLWTSWFPEFIVKNKLPLDAYSFHQYSSASLSQRDFDTVENTLNKYPYFNTTTMYLTEWNINDWGAGRGAGGPGAACQQAVQLMHDYKIWLERQELTSISWTAYSGLIDGKGRRRAIFNAWKLYGNMPVDRRRVTVVGPVEAMASVESHRAGVLIWNHEPLNRRLDVSLNNLPFKKGNVKIFRIDTKNADVDDGAPEQLAATETFNGVDLTSFAWQDGQIPPFGILYFEADDGTGISELTPAKVGNVIRINRYYPQRGKTKSYSTFDRKTWIARLGMAQQPAADEEIGVLADGLPDNLDVDVKLFGRLRKVDVNSLLGMRVDYVTASGAPKSVLVHGPLAGVDLYDPARKAPMQWGYKQKVDTVLPVKDFSSFRIPLKANAPAGWSGEAHLSFIMHNAGAGAVTTITVRQGS
jgi:xylan 1,4-beta-xylosidase